MQAATEEVNLISLITEHAFSVKFHLFLMLCSYYIDIDITLTPKQMKVGNIFW
jgi:hypothetical protein